MTEYDIAQHFPAAMGQLPPAVLYVIGAVAVTWIFWALYVFVMGLYRAKLNGRLQGLNYVLGYPIFVVALLLDIVFNWTLAIIMFLDLPRETLVTSRLQRYMVGEDGWRKTVAKYVCDNLLDPFDPTGDHC